MTIFAPIHHTFAPHVDSAYVVQSLALLLQPWKWQHGPATSALEHALATRFDGKAHLFFSGREGLLALLQSMHLKPGDEVIVQTYTCVAVPNAITAAGAVPVYADIDQDSLNMTAKSVRSVLSDRTRAVMCQHTFGIPAPAKELRALCDERSLLFIEDCAHVIPDGESTIGRYGDYLLLSFGRDKAISGIAGGALIDKTQHYKLQTTNYKLVSPLTIAILLLYPLLYAIARPLYALGIGKALLALARMIGLLRAITTSDEKHGQMDTTLHAIPHAFAALAHWQLQKLPTINKHRRMLTTLYRTIAEQEGWINPAGISDAMPLQKFPLFVRDADGIRRRLKAQNIHLDDGWTTCVICPSGVDFDPVHYVPGSDPEAEAACQKILSLPTHPTMTIEQAKHLVDVLRKSMKYVV